MRRLLFIANASAGSSDREVLDAVIGTLEEQADVRVVSTETIEELTDAIAGRDGREVVLAGGDGTLHAFASALCLAEGLGTDPPVVGLVPMGTGNDFARATDLPQDPHEAARVILASRARPVDVLVDAEDRVVVNAVHIGVGEEAGRIAAPWKERLSRLRLGLLGYVIGGLAAGLGQQGRHLRVVADEEVIADGRRRVLQVAVTIGSDVGGGTTIAPEAALGDGRAEVVVSWAVTPWRRLRYLVNVRLKRHAELDDVVTTRARTVTVTGVRHEVAANADGESIAPAREHSWRVVPEAYYVHTPVGTT